MTGGTPATLMADKRGPFIVAELSCNHLGSQDRAIRIAEAAAEAGATGFKVQCWSPGMMCLDREYRLSSGPWAGRLLFDLYEEAFTPWDWIPGLFDRCRALGMEPFGAAFDRESVDFLDALEVKLMKVASFELVDLPLVRYMASKGKPLILSTGMASAGEIVNAYSASNAAPQRTFLKCCSAYPAPIDEANLATLDDLYAWLGYPVGLSDHTPGHAVAAAAAALGATYIEKHLTLKRADGGPDAGFSLEPAEFKAMVQACKTAAAARGTSGYGPSPSESTALRRSLYISAPVRKGELLELGRNVRSARPALGLPPSTDISGHLAARNAEPGEPLTQDMLA